jgi:hypothetical protein
MRFDAFWRIEPAELGDCPEEVLEGARRSDAWGTVRLAPGRRHATIDHC